MKFIFRIIFLLFLFTTPTIIKAQEAKPSSENSPSTTKAQRKKAKAKWKEKRKADMEHKKMVKQHHKKLQSKETKKRMKKEKKKSDKLRANKKEFFLKRWFNKKFK